jgi:hypothetical protein
MAVWRMACEAVKPDQVVKLGRGRGLMFTCECVQAEVEER